MLKIVAESGKKKSVFIQNPSFINPIMLSQIIANYK